MAWPSCAEKITDGMKDTIEETDALPPGGLQQRARDHPQALKKSKEQILAQALLPTVKRPTKSHNGKICRRQRKPWTTRIRRAWKAVEKTRKEMEKAAKALDFIQAAALRDRLLELESKRSTVRG